jgi:hypothetical protein
MLKKAIIAPALPRALFHPPSPRLREQALYPKDAPLPRLRSRLQTILNVPMEGAGLAGSGLGG